MSAVAGRVMPLPRGAYNPNTQYHILDIVTYSNAAYIALQTTQGNAPTNTTYWQKLVDSATELAQLSDIDITNIQNGQTLIYNSTTGMFENGTIDLTNKADRVSGATNGNFAGLNVNGNLTDSGKKASDFVLSTAVGTAAAKNVPSSGNASSTQVVMGNDTRLSDARPASDVPSWAKASSKPTYTASEVGAAAASHSQAASTITAGTLSGRVQANASAAGTLGNAQVRDIYAGTSDMTAGTSNLATGTIYLVYEA